MFDEHLKKSKITYLAHLRWALISGIRLIYAGVASIIHGLLPTLFSRTAPRTVIDIFHSHLVDHPNDEYKEMIKESMKKNDKIC